MDVPGRHPRPPLLPSRASSSPLNNRGAQPPPHHLVPRRWESVLRQEAASQGGEDSLEGGRLFLTLTQAFMEEVAEGARLHPDRRSFSEAS